MDEKGIQLGFGVRITAMIDQDQKTIYSIEDGNRELVMVIETICADGSVLHPSVIFQGQQQIQNGAVTTPVTQVSYHFSSKGIDLTNR
jgi:hypothetical protein